MTHCGPSSSVTRRYGGPWQTLWTQQQRDEAVRGPMADLGPGSTYGRPVICQQPMTKWKPAGV
ncbi:unnamed protein product [Staurois parvus]|uniref:Uncharacterized protein n=1 Tax=Staurois parvus TaxID=386267 RepID=A0ABN9A656_9NEOB|nr:unnamed protein product [Staurois parvus]